MLDQAGRWSKGYLCEGRVRIRGGTVLGQGHGNARLSRLFPRACRRQLRQRMGRDGGSAARQQFHGGHGLRELSRRGPVSGQGRVLALRGISVLEHVLLLIWNRLRCALARRPARRDAKSDAVTSVERRNNAGARPRATPWGRGLLRRGFVEGLDRSARYALRPSPAPAAKSPRRRRFHMRTAALLLAPALPR